MRLFPRTARARLTVLLAALSLILGALAIPLALADDLKDKQRSVERQLDRANDDLRESSRQARRATERLRAAEGRLAEARGHLAGVQGQLARAQARDAEMAAALEAAEARVEQSRADLQVGRQRLGEQRDQVASVISSIYTGGDPQLLGFVSLLEAEDPADITRRLEAMDVMVGQEARAYDDLRAAEVLLVVQRNSVRKAREAVATQREEAAANLAEVASLEQQARAATAQVQTLVADSAQARRAASQARQRDLRQIRKLEQEQKRIQEMLRRRAAAAARRAGTLTPGPSGGFLSYPVKGYVTSAFGMRTHPIYGYRSLHDGTDFGTGGCGAPMYASADGRVISRYYQTAWGNRLIIDHGIARGVSLATIYNHATHYTVSAGQRVKRGQVIGYVGNTGWSTGCHLHFTVMSNGNPVDPMRWF